MINEQKHFNKITNIDNYDYIECGDCLELMKGIPDKSIDLIVTGPPYGINYQSNMRVKSNKFDVLKNDDSDLRFLVFQELERVLKHENRLISCLGSSCGKMKSHMQSMTF